MKVDYSKLLYNLIRAKDITPEDTKACLPAQIPTVKQLCCLGACLANTKTKAFRQYHCTLDRLLKLFLLSQT
jgi:hypothetical protein